MKGVVSLSLLTLALVFSMALGHAGTITFTVDEFGNGSFSGASSGVVPSCTACTDPSGGVGNVLFYVLPSFAAVPVSGDVILDEPGGTVAPILSDYVRFFTDVNNVHYLIFYSDTGDGVDAPADTGFPGNPSTNLLHIPEVGPEGNNGALYSPTGAQPGTGNGDNVYVYNIISDSTVPEPTSLVLMAAGLAGLGLKKYWRR